ARRRVVPLRMIMKVVRLPQVFKKQPTRPVRARRGMKKVHFFSLSVIRTQSNQISLACENINQFVLTKEATNCGVAFSDLITCLDRRGDVVIFAEPETQNGVGNIGRPPVRDKEIESAELC